jgi:hypothetical protein
MKIASKIHPRSGKPRTVTVHGRPYVFKPLQDRNEQAHFVADVADARAAETFLASGDFYAYSADMEKKASLTRNPPAVPSPAPTPTPTPTPSGELGAVTTDPVKQAAEELLKGSVSDIGRAVGNTTAETIRAALALEEAQETPRKTVVKLLQSTLDGMKAAGVAG